MKMGHEPDKMIDVLIARKGAKPRLEGLGWSETHRLIPRGHASNEQRLAESLKPHPEGPAE